MRGQGYRVFTLSKAPLILASSWEPGVAAAARLHVRDSHAWIQARPDMRPRCPVRMCAYIVHARVSNREALR